MEKKYRYYLSWTGYKNQEITQSYIDWIEKQLKGEVTKSLDEADILIVPGGADIGVNVERDRHEIDLILYFASIDKPIFGICRGLQLLGFVEGCELIPHIPDLKEQPALILEHGNGSSKFTDCSNWHIVRRGGNSVFEVNSRHHQGFMFPATLNCIDGIVEAMDAEDVKNHLGRQGNLKYTKYFAVQWHPERKEMWDKDASKFVKKQIENLLKSK